MFQKPKCDGRLMYEFRKDQLIIDCMIKIQKFIIAKKTKWFFHGTKSEVISKLYDEACSKRLTYLPKLVPGIGQN